jgi:predicted alpha/beta superfamily hydrolase
VRLLRLQVLTLAVACTRPSAPEQPRASATVAALGETFTLDSKRLGERRVINVYVPPGYREGTTRYPVLYMPDGGMAEDFPHVVGAVDVSIKNAVIRPVIVVGIENTERRRDLAPPTEVAEEREAAPNAGGTERFRAFLRDELKPAIAARYRTTTESAIIGESLAGLFVIETLLVEPALFDAYLTADPSLWWNEDALVRGHGVTLARWSAGGKQLYFATSGELAEHTGTTLLLTALRIYAPADVAWHHEHMPDEQHGTIYPRAALRGIRRIFAAPRDR